MSNSYRVLVVEDEPLMREYLIASLPRLHPAFVVAGAAHDGLAALALFEKSSYDLMITDLRMPGMDGLQLIERIRSLGKTLPIIVLTGYDEFEYARTALHFGVAEYLLKPLNDDALRETLERLAGAIQQHLSAIQLPQNLSPKNIAQFVATCFTETDREHKLLAERAASYITTHFTEPITQTDVAEALGITPAYLSSVFHEEKGESYTKFLTRLRMMQAALLLKSNPGMTIQSVAEQAGYASDKHFISVFKKYFGTTPNEYRLSKVEE
ncbi:MAG: response regulator [Christensenella sp.]|nr:response regulator [Christensenella sp.]